MKFGKWLEYRQQSNDPGVKDTIVGFLRDELHIQDDDVILGMSTTDMQQSVITKLLSLGMVSTSSPDIIHRIKEGMTIQELVDALSDSANTSVL